MCDEGVCSSGFSTFNMNEFLKMDIFFVVTTIVAILVGAFLTVALFYVVRILKSVDNVARNVSEESNDLRGDIAALRTKIKEEGMKLKHFGDFVSGIASRQKRRRAASTKSE